MTDEILPRRLWHEVDGRVETFEQSALGTLERPVVVLGEPGMGKTELLHWLCCKPGHVFCTARQLQNARPDARKLLGNAHTLVIDALDELSARGEGDAVDLVLQKLGDAGYPNFVLSCRAAEWRSATNVAAIREQYNVEPPLELHLERLSDQEIRYLLATKLDSNTDRADAVIAHFSDAGLEGLLGNPQTLQLVARVAYDGPLPKTKAELFEHAVEILRKEHRDEKADLQPAEATALDAAGAAFAAIILTGSNAVVTQMAEFAEGEIPLNEVTALPLAGELGKVLGSRLFATAGAAGRFTYWHRSIGEYLGSRWLVRQATTVLKRKRLLALFHLHSMVPASLRGLHAWLAHHDPFLALDVIATDPMGVIEYGEVDALNASQAEHLLASLERLAAYNPHFRRGWRRYSLKGLAQPSVLGSVRRLINDAGTGSDLRLLLIEAVNDSPIAEALRPDLHRIGLDADTILSHRLQAIGALVALGGEDWPTIVGEFQKRNHEDETRLCIEIIDAAGSALFSETQIIDVAISYAQFERLHVYAFTRMVDELAIERLDTLLDVLIRQLEALGHRHERKGNNELNDVGYKLIGRRLASGPVDAMRLWAWLKPFDEQYGYRRDNRGNVHKSIRENEPLRRALQRFVLLDEPSTKTLYERAWRLRSRSPGFDPTPDDVCVLLRLLDPAAEDDGRWRDLLKLIPHSVMEGGEARELAKRLVPDRPDMLAWIDRLSTPPMPEWKIKQEREERRRAAKRAMEWQEHRNSYRQHIDAMRRGEYAAIISPAQVYIGLTDYFDKQATPQDRLLTWLGKELASAALAGFEAFLQSYQPPSAQQVAESHGESQSWNAIAIIMAGLSERVRLGKDLNDVTQDQLTTGFYELQISYANDHASISGLRSAVEEQMQARGLKEEALKAWIEPQLRHQRPHVDQLYQLMRDAPRHAQAADLAVEWLTRYPDMSPDPEALMIDRLLESGRLGDIRALIATRLIRSLPDDRRRLWEAVAFFADFEAHRKRLLSTAATDPAWLWAVQGRIGGDHGRRISPMLSVDQLVWLVTTFRHVFPVVETPKGVINGDKHPWDATQFLLAVASRLADMVTDEAVAGLAMLVTALTDRYSTYLRALAAEQRGKLAETRYQPPHLKDVRAVVESQPPQTTVDLQATLLALLEILQKRIRANPADSWVGFFTDGGEPLGEELCRNHLLTMLGEYPENIDLQPEGHMAQDKRADIIAQIRGLRLPIEIKGQWHDALWHAADTQLDRFYTTDYAAERRGIYLILWFGDQVPASKKLKSQGRESPPPSTPEELRSRLFATSQAAQEGRVEIVVLACTRPHSS